MEMTSVKENKHCQPGNRHEHTVKLEQKAVHSIGGLTNEVSIASSKTSTHTRIL